MVEPGPSPTRPGGDSRFVRRSPNALRGREEAAGRSFAGTPIWYSEHEGTVCKRSVITAVSRETGRRYETALAEFFTFRDGQIVRAEAFHQDAIGFIDAVSRA